MIGSSKFWVTVLGLSLGILNALSSVAIAQPSSHKVRTRKSSLIGKSANKIISNKTVSKATSNSQAHATQVPTVLLNLPGGHTLVMVRIPAGSFQMGSPSRERSRTPMEGPSHIVAIAHDFYLGQYEVTQAQWETVMGVNPSHIQSAKGYSEDLNRPVDSISWNDIAGPGGFIERLNQHLKATRHAGRVRLPSEAEWEYACRAGAQARFYFGDSLGGNDESTNAPPGSGGLSYSAGDYMWFGANSDGMTHGVGQKSPNAWGLYDMAGNVWEWVQDWAHDNYNGAPVDGSSWLTPPGKWRVVRGGAWDNTAGLCRSASRSTYSPADVSDDLGFRLAWNP